MIPYGRQFVDEDDIEAVVKVLRSEFLTQGPAVEQFEEQLAAFVEARYAVAFANGTAALHAACAAADIGSGDTVFTTPLTFVASANCARYVGASVDFIDIDPGTLNLDPARVPARADALVAVHYAGLPVDLTALAHRPPVVIEDAAHAIGARTTDGPVGNCAHSDLTTFSFHPVKTITSAEGGAVTTNDPMLAERLRTFRTHGITQRPDIAGWHYDIEELGYNYRLSDVHAALGSSQLQKVDRFVARRNALADRYDELLSDLPVTPAPRAPAGSRHGRHLYPVLVNDRARVYQALRARGVGVQVHYVPVTHHRTFGLDRAAQQRFPMTEAAYARLLSLPLFPTLDDREQDDIVACLRAVV